MTTIAKPPFYSVPLATGLAWRGGAQQIFQEKIDGVWATQEVRGQRSEVSLALGERTRDGVFHAFDCVEFEGTDLRAEPLHVRLRALAELCSLTSDLRPVASGNGGEFLEAVLARGGEGVVCKSLTAPFGAPWTKCKRLQVFYGIVRELRPATGAVRVDLVHESWKECPGRLAPFEAVNFEDFVTGDDGGWIRLGARFEAVKIGAVLKLEAFGQHASGMLREARLDKDTPDSWIVRI